MSETATPERSSEEYSKKAKSASASCPYVHWVELEHGTEYVLDKGQFEPAADTPFRITFGDGSQSDGRLNAVGFARFDGIPPGPVQVEYEPDLDARIKELKQQLKQYLDEIIQEERAQYLQIEKELEEARVFGLDFPGSNTLAKYYKYRNALAKGVWNGIVGIFEFAWTVLKGAGKILYELGLRTNPITAPQTFKEDLRRLKQTHEQLQRFADEDLEAYVILMGDSEVHETIKAFGGEYISQQHFLEMTEAGGEVLFDVALAVLTGGAGAAASVRHAAKLKKLKTVVDELVDLLKRKKRKQLREKDVVDKRHTSRVQPNLPKCFCPFGKAGSRRARQYDNMPLEKKKKYLKEYEEQLRRQQDAINKMSVDDYLLARDKFNKTGRNPNSQAFQAQKRTEVSDEIWDSIYRGLLEDGVDESVAKDQASARTKSIMKTIDALHEPDQVAGGWFSPATRTMGDRSVNRGLGSSWNQQGRLDAIDKQAEAARLAGKGNEKMNVRLTVCRGRGHCP